MTAYFGMLDYCQAKKGNVVVVTAAAGAVGHVACQMAKILGCTVIAFTGSDEKVSWLKSELNLQYVFNYKTKSIDDALAESNINQVDCYFDNVGGEQSNTIMNYMNPGSHLCICGSISEDSQEESVVRMTSFCLSH
ncbi:NADP-dependent oxidoreductase [Trichuris trichiura]|uniref:NADP-dependent oxidoreductase n=1 Tax=Trichuris trichiura TaxID=36087 RepID=A0A077ZA01_TRITR|nr:NADP-dependent oxidoreductase [Trichuris trichiura]